MTDDLAWPKGALSRPAWVAASIGLIGVGLVWRLVPLGLPGFALKYGGSVLWAAMVYCLCAALLVGRPSTTVAGVAGLVALATELARLYHQPWLDAFRLTLPGALLMGQIFSPWNLVAYAVGIGAVAAGERLLSRRSPSRWPRA